MSAHPSLFELRSSSKPEAAPQTISMHDIFPILAPKPDMRQSSPASSSTASNSPSMSPMESKQNSNALSQPQVQTQTNDEYAHWNWNPFAMDSSQAECLACGYRYSCVEELAVHQRLTHGLAEVIF